MRRAHDALMLRTILRVSGDGVGWAWIVDEVDDLFDPPLVSGRYRTVQAVRCIAFPARAVVEDLAAQRVAGRRAMPVTGGWLEARE